MDPKPPILLSVLIPSIPRRLPKLAELIAQFEAQAHPQLEVLVYMDNCRRFLGQKRNALMREAAGAYLCHIDDDESVSPEFFARLLPELQHGVDLVHFNAIVHLGDWPPFTVRTRLGAENGQPQHLPDGRLSDVVRTPWHWNCWRTGLARCGKFPQYFDAAEDATWLKQVLPLVQTSRYVNEPLFIHNYDTRTSTFPTK